MGVESVSFVVVVVPVFDATRPFAGPFAGPFAVARTSFVALVPEFAAGAVERPIEGGMVFEPM
jgi:hypothetical protein